MSLSALPTFLAIPPVNLVLGAGAGAVLRRRAVVLACLGALLILGMPVIAGCLTWPLETGLQPAPENASGAGAIVILSGDQQKSLDRAGGTVWRSGPMTLEREAAGVVLARRTGLPVLVSGGRTRDDAPSLAGEMAESMSTVFGMAPKWQEDRSLDTWQNLQFSERVLKSAGIRRVLLVTHAWHMKRSMIACKAAELDCVAAPVMMDAKPDLSWSGIVPSVKGWVESYLAIHELIGWAVYSVR